MMSPRDRKGKEIKRQGRIRKDLRKWEANRKVNRARAMQFWETLSKKSEIA